MTLKVDSRQQPETKLQSHDLLRSPPVFNGFDDVTRRRNGEMKDEEAEPPLDAIVSIPRDSDGSSSGFSSGDSVNLGPSRKVTSSLSPPLSVPEQEQQRHHTRRRSGQS